jgi:hypothetical protein
MATSRRRALQLNNSIPAWAYQQGLGSDATTLCTAIRHLSRGAYKALKKEAGPLKRLERHGQLTKEGKVTLAVIGCSILLLPGLLPNNRPMRRWIQSERRLLSQLANKLTLGQAREEDEKACLNNNEKAFLADIERDDRYLMWWIQLADSVRMIRASRG